MNRGLNPEAKKIQRLQDLGDVSVTATNSSLSNLRFMLGRRFLFFSNSAKRDTGGEKEIHALVLFSAKSLRLFKINVCVMQYVRRQMKKKKSSKESNDLKNQLVH